MRGIDEPTVAPLLEALVATLDSFVEIGLGYLSLDSNERSAYKARELKSVYLKARGVFFKLLLHKCHINVRGQLGAQLLPEAL